MDEEELEDEEEKKPEQPTVEVDKTEEHQLELNELLESGKFQSQIKLRRIFQHGFTPWESQISDPTISSRLPLKYSLTLFSKISKSY